MCQVDWGDHSCVSGGLGGPLLCVRWIGGTTPVCQVDWGDHSFVSGGLGRPLLCVRWIGGTTPVCQVDWGDHSCYKLPHVLLHVCLPFRGSLWGEGTRHTQSISLLDPLFSLLLPWGCLHRLWVGNRPMKLLNMVSSSG